MTGFDQHERILLGRLSDVLIPADGEMPSASAADVTGLWLDQVLAARPDLAQGLKDLLRKAQGREPQEVVADLQRNDVVAFSVLAEVTAGAYFMNPRVRQSLGYDGQNARPIDPRPDYEDLLEAVVRRGSIYRPTKEIEDV